QTAKRFHLPTGAKFCRVCRCSILSAYDIFRMCSISGRATSGRKVMLKKIDFESFRSSRWFKPVLAVIGAILLVLIVLLVAPKFIDINTYRSQIITQLERRLGRSVKLGAMELSALPSIRIKVDDVVIGDDPQFAQAEFVKARSVKLRIGLWSLLRGS